MNDRVIKTTQGDFEVMPYDTGLQMVIEPGTENEEKLYVIQVKAPKV